MIEETKSADGALAGVSDSTQLLGVLNAKSTMIFHERAGTAEDGDTTYTLINSMTGEPLVRSSKTGKEFYLPWKDILTLAIRAGINT